MKLDDKVALISGAAQGIGFGIAKRFVRASGCMAMAHLNLQTAPDAAAARNRIPCQPASAAGYHARLQAKNNYYFPTGIVIHVGHPSWTIIQASSRLTGSCP
jgi:NAD(P)-dependent dehydrogenase (short-subunit alcohol dehydrogenase family)